MRYLKRLRSYIKGSLIPVAAIILAFTFSIWTGVRAFSYYYDISLNYRIVKNNTLKNAYFWAKAIGPSDFSSNSLDEFMKQAIERLRSDERIDKLFFISGTSPVKYKGKGITIGFYEEGITDAFPELKNMGMDFSDDPDGCILASRIFNDVRTGSDFEIICGPPGNTAVTMHSIGHLVYPYKHLYFGGGGTKLSANDLFAPGDCLLMQATETNISRFSQLTSIIYSPDILFSLKDNVTSEEINDITTWLSDYGTLDTLDSIIENSRQDLQITLKKELLRPAVFMCASLVAFFSISIYMSKMKEKELAVGYICGASRKRLTLFVVSVNCITALIPALANICFILMAPNLHWEGLLSFDGMLYSQDLIWVVILYFAAAALVSALGVWISIGGRSPLIYLRGIE